VLEEKLAEKEAREKAQLEALRHEAEDQELKDQIEQHKEDVRIAKEKHDAAQKAFEEEQRLRQEEENKRKRKRVAKAKLIEIRKYLDTMWGKLDKNGDGFVEFNELFDALKEGSPDRAELMKLFSQAIGDSDKVTTMSAKILDLLDVNDDARISKLELYTQFMLEVEMVTMFEAAVEYDGASMSKVEFEHLLMEHPEINVLLERRGLEPHTVFEQMDKNKDGVVTCVEFLTQLHRHGRVADLFGQLDSDNSGTVTKQEITSALSGPNAASIKELLQGVGIDNDSFILEQLEANPSHEVSIGQFMKLLTVHHRASLGQR